jgi:NAD(P)-dependent dehydrogenase (short-subunit alcohol dehydrogenase family)
MCASQGAGAAIARELARAGASVTLSYRPGKEAAEEIAGEIGGGADEADVSARWSSAPEAHPYFCNVTTSVNRFLAQTLDLAVQAGFAQRPRTRAVVITSPKNHETRPRAVAEMRPNDDDDPTRTDDVERQLPWIP